MSEQQPPAPGDPQSPGGAPVPLTPLLSDDPPKIGDFWLDARLIATPSGVAYAGHDDANTPVMLLLLSEGAANDPAARDRLAGLVNQLHIDTVIARGGHGQDEGRLGNKYRHESDDPVDPGQLEDLANDLQSAWDAPGTTMRNRQRLVRTLIEDIIADIDEATGEIVLVIHWKGGRHTELRTKKPKPGEHGAKTSDEALGVIREMAGRWSDEAVAACLNRMGMRTGQGKTWNAKRVSSIRRVNDIRAYLSADKDGPYRTMTEAAQELGVTNHVIRRLIKGGILPASQVVEGAPYQIRVEDLRSEPVQVAIERKGRPCRADNANQLSMFPDT